MFCRTLHGPCSQRMSVSSRVKCSHGADPARTLWLSQAMTEMPRVAVLAEDYLPLLCLASARLPTHALQTWTRCVGGKLGKHEVRWRFSAELTHVFRFSWDLLQVRHNIHAFRIFNHVFRIFLGHTSGIPHVLLRHTSGFPRFTPPHVRYSSFLQHTSGFPR